MPFPARRGKFEVAKASPAATPPLSEVKIPYFLLILDHQLLLYLLYSTNHQALIDWENYAASTYTRERQQFLESCLSNPEENLESITDRFLEDPLFNTDYEKGFGTLYTTIYYPQEKKMKLLWQQNSWEQSFDSFTEQKIAVKTTTSNRNSRLVK